MSKPKTIIRAPAAQLRHSFHCCIGGAPPLLCSTSALPPTSVSAPRRRSAFLSHDGDRAFSALSSALVCVLVCVRRERRAGCLLEIAIAAWLTHTRRAAHQHTNTNSEDKLLPQHQEGTNQSKPTSKCATRVATKSLRWWVGGVRLSFARCSLLAARCSLLFLLLCVCVCSVCRAFCPHTHTRAARTSLPTQRPRIISCDMVFSP